MGTITKRKRGNGTFGYTAQIRLKRDGKVIFTEAQTFDRRSAASAWMKKREGELAKPGALERPKGEDPKLRDVIDQYFAESEKEHGRTKAQVLRTIKTHDIADKRCSQITSTVIVAFLQELDVTPATRSSYLSFLGSIFTVARPMWGYPLDDQQMDDAWLVARKMGIIGKSQERDRRPTFEELDKLMTHFQERNHRRPSSNPMHYVIGFAIFSTRRMDEIARIAWDDYDKEGKRVLVRDMKNPGEKVGNDVWCDLVPEAIAIIEAMPRVADQIFPYSPDAMGAAFTRACYLLGINTEEMPEEKRLHFHDLRHDGVSRLFEMGWNIPHVAAVSGHRSWKSLQRYTHLRQSGNKYEGWKWLPVISTPIEREKPTTAHRTRRLRRDRPGVAGLVTRGEASPLHKLTEKQVAEIRASKDNISALARLYNVSRTLIRSIRKGKVWKEAA
ncbi:integrase [Burkholderia phage vB_BceS_AH2]|uniref:Integrase n=1 Tax=Burkholderia phage vB_BceS_AH2 TaxID=1133022 RepID=I6NSG1_9CAUD|nr:integrase [Burkholderia phage vB_BceS_AH2]AEY69547.1 integrase [Burkholderia phage vB_BceS_AH2]